MNNEQLNKIKCKAILGLPLTEKERSYYLLFIANNEQVKEFLRKEQERWKIQSYANLWNDLQTHQK